jgi:hypothetical protein
MIAIKEMTGFMSLNKSLSYSGVSKANGTIPKNPGTFQ